MNLNKLFDMQRVLDQRIIDKHPELKGQDNVEWKVLALQVELGECANEWRGFKKWSNDQEPRTFKREKCPYCEERGISVYSLPRFEQYWCETCAGYTTIDKNPLLEEYVDCLHFILSIFIELGFTDIEIWNIPEENTMKHFIKCFENIGSIYFVYCVEGKVSMEICEGLFGAFIALGESLGFTWEQVEEAYFKKNAVNHNRQESGY
ncbi:dUTP diphosphatase [Priestia aryabhattai]|uniref:dUTP diphosphatase n=1 Tax=Priestia aryabhattai TaxID=412384 RepID=UPI003CBE80F7